MDKIPGADLKDHSRTERILHQQRVNIQNTEELPKN